jgi:hypothetical protein
MEQELDYSPELHDWVHQSGTLEGKGAVSMLNLFACRDGERQVYTRHVQVSGAQVGKEVGAEAEPIDQVVNCSSTQAGNKRWEDAAILHYPWIYHSADLLCSEEYQKPYAKYMVGTIKDTCILCMTELQHETLFRRYSNWHIYGSPSCFSATVGQRKDFDPQMVERIYDR